MDEILGRSSNFGYNRLPRIFAMNSVKTITQK
jgi:hypothetical protein